MIDYTRCIMFATLEASKELKPELPNPSIINPLSLVDAYLRQIIECAKGPLTHICVKGEGARFNRPFGCYKWAMSMSISVQA